MYNQNLIPKDYKFIPKLKTESELINKFRTLREHVSGFRYKMIPIAKKLFGWGIFDFHIYYYTPEVQLYLIHNERKKEKEPRLHKNLSKKLVEYQELCKQENRAFSSKEFYEYYGVSHVLLGYYNLLDEVAAAREIRKEQLMSEEIQSCWSLAMKYTEKLLKEKQPFNCESVYRSIGKRRMWLLKNCPDLAQWIHQQVDLSKRQQAAKRLNVEKNKVKETIQYLLENDMNLSKANIAKYSGIRKNKLLGKTELGLFYNKVIQDMSIGG